MHILELVSPKHLIFVFFYCVAHTGLKFVIIFCLSMLSCLSSRILIGLHDVLITLLYRYPAMMQKPAVVWGA